MLLEQLDGCLHGKERKQNLASKLTFLGEEEEKQKQYSVKEPLQTDVIREANSYGNFKQMRNGKQLSSMLLTQIPY